MTADKSTFVPFAENEAGAASDSAPLAHSEPEYITLSEIQPEILLRPAGGVR
jgi:hypothetical protein